MKMNKIISFLLTLAIIIGTFPATLVSAEWDGTAAASLSGTGTDNDPYIISNAAELKLAEELINANANNEAKAAFSLVADIDYEGKEWTPIAKNGAFNGKFFGGYHVIKNLKITTYQPSANHGFFARTGGFIHGLGLENVTVEIAVSNSSSQPARIGAFVGLAAGTISECYVANSTVREMKPTQYGLGVGIFGGLCQYSNITNCYVYNSTIAASSSVACFIGRPENNGNTITNCYAANITVDNTGVTNGKEAANVGRFIFEHKPANATVSNCHSNFEGSTINDFVKTYSGKDVVVEDLVTNLTDTKFAVNSAVNGGYPYLASFPVSVPEVTEAPTEAPTATPVVTEAPTEAPTATPVVTEAPTEAPTATPVVTQAPTTAPTATPEVIVSATSFAGGSGTASDPWLISNASELKRVSDVTGTNANGESSAYYKLTADIDYKNNEWTPISLGNAFAGNLDGDGHVIKNFQITKNHTLTGFFYDMDGTAVVTDLGLENARVFISSTEGKDLWLVGIFAARTAGKITNCFVRNSVIEQHSGATEWALAAFSARSRTANDVYTNCYVYNVKMYSKHNKPYAFFGQQDKTGQTFKNCYVAGITTTNESYYAFGPNTDYTVTNCYSSLTDTGVTGKSGVTYAADKNAIVTGLVTNNATTDYVVSENVNNGYPAFGWQVWNGVPSLTLLGAGTAESPYLISTAADLKYASTLANSTGNSAYYKLTADIDYLNGEWMPIGRNQTFKGHFDGAGHVVKNLKITDFGTQYSLIGFFGDADMGSRIENLGIENLNIQITARQQIAYIGGFVGRLGGTVKNCYVKNVTVANTGNYGEFGAGAFAGAAWRSGIFINCYVYGGAMNSKAVPGAFIGKLDASATFNNCYTAGVTFTNTSYRGFGNESKKADVNNSYTTVTTVGADADIPAIVTDKTGIVAGLVTNLVKTPYAVDASVNDGYPYLVYTAPAVKPDAPAHDGNINVVLMGDSLMDDVLNEIAGNVDDKTGWGGKIGNYLDSEKVTLVHHGHNSQIMKHFINGRTTYHTCSWDSIKNEFGAHDYVIIALGTNDNNCIDNKANDFYSTGQFKEWYKEIIADARFKNAEVIVLTPPPIGTSVTNDRYTALNWYSRNALLELENEVENLTVIDVSQAFADSINVLIDDHGYTAEDMAVKKNGDTIVESGLIYVDWGHFSEYGADLLAWTISQEIAKETSGLEDYVVTKSMPLPTTSTEPTATPAPTTAPTTVPTAAPTTAPTATPVPGEIIPATALPGNGTESMPYIISNASELMKANEMINSSTTYASAHYKVTADIDYQNYEWVPLGRPHSDGFAGTFDGGNHIIKNVKVTNFGDQNAINGFFASASDTTVIKNLGIENFNLNIYTNKQTAYIGGFIGRGAGTISNCYIKNSSVVNTGNFVEWGTGAFAGCAWRSAHFINCYAYNVSVSAKTTPGAFIGKLDDVTKFTNCYTAGITFTNASYRGFGSATKSATITNSYTAVQSVGTSDHLNATYTDKDGIVAGLVTNLADTVYGVSADINDGFPHLLSFIPDPNQADVDADAAALVVPASATGAFKLQTVGENGSTIEWQSSNSDVIAITGGDTTVICGDDNVTVTLVATVTKGRASTTVMFDVVVKARVESELTAGELVVTDTATGRDVSIDISYSGLYDKGYTAINFMVVAVDEKGDILARGMDSVAVVNSDSVTTETLSTTLDTKTGTVKHYIWGDNNASLIDNTPMEVANLTAKSKTKGISLSWDASFDDSGDAVQYEIYSGNTLLTTTTKTTYMANGSLTEARSFNVIAVDSNGKKAEVVTSKAATMMSMYYNNPTAQNAIWKTASNGTPGGDGDSYYVVQDAIIGGVETKVYVTETSTRDRMIYFARADAIKGSDAIPRTERNLTFEVDYLDNSTKPLTFVYNSVIPAGATDSWQLARKAISIPRVNDGLWKTVVIHVTDAELRNSGQTGGAEFGILASKGTPTDETQVREIRMCRTEDYE